MFLRYLPSRITYEAVDPSESGYAVPSSTLRLQMTCPAKSVSGSKSGPIAAMSYFEAIHCRKTAPGKVPDARVDSLIAAAQALDIACADDNEFIPSDEGYVSFYNFMKAVAAENKLSTGSLQWANTIAGLKQMIHRRGAALVEMFLVNSMLTANAAGAFNISSVGTGKTLKHDYTKVVLAVGFD